MLQKPTSELLEALSNSETIQDYLNHSQNDMLQSTISQHLTKLAVEKNLSKSTIFKNSEINEIYGYQIFAGSRMPSRDKLICLCLGMKLNANETATVLKYASYAPLYPRNRRDSIILYGIINSASIYDINEWLYDEKEDTLI